MNIVFCASEIFPFSKTGGLADVCGALPLALNDLGMKVSIFQPKYRCIDEKKFGLEKVRDGLFKARFHKSIDVYFIDCPDLYDRDGIYGDENGDYPDNFERFDCFNRKVLEALKQIGDPVDVIHCHDWQTSLIPVYLKFQYQDDAFFKNIKSVLTIHNLAYQGLFPKEFFGRFDFASEESLQQSGMYFYGKLSLLRAGIVSSDVVTTVSAQYAKEIQTEEMGCGMDDVLSARKNGVAGVLNGLDYSVWDPECDGLIASRYSGDAPELKSANKSELQLNAGLPVRADVPVFGFVGRFSHQKGVDLLAESASALLENDIQLVFLGVGDQESQKKIADIANRYPNKVALYLAFDEQLAHQIYAGSDFFLMPSIFEPCGLSQMISLCYGTIPIVYKTGGLADTVTDVADGGNGFVFDQYRKDAFVKTVFEAIDLYHDCAAMSEVVARTFQDRFLWDDAAKHYQAIYRDAVRS